MEKRNDHRMYLHSRVSGRNLRKQDAGSQQDRKGKRVALFNLWL